MELEDLKTAWKSVGVQIEQLSNLDCGNLPRKEKTDAKTKVMWRVLTGALFSLAGLVLMASSRLWAPLKLPVLWVIAISVVIFIGLVSEIYLARMIYRINLCENTNYEVFTRVIHIKKLYRTIELILSVLAIMVFGSLSIWPPLQNSPSIIVIWGLLSLGLVLEYIWYRRNGKYLDEMGSHD